MGFHSRDFTPAPLTESLDAVEKMRIEMGATPADLVATDVQSAREALIEAMKTADRLGDGELHRQVADRVLALDDLMTWLSDWSSS